MTLKAHRTFQGYFNLFSVVEISFICPTTHFSLFSGLKLFFIFAGRKTFENVSMNQKLFLTLDESGAVNKLNIL